MKLIKKQPKYPFLDFEKRKDIVPRKNVISIEPAAGRADYFYTGNGHFYLESAGGVEEDEIVVTEEHLYEPLWSTAPLPPDLRPYINDIRKCVLGGTPEKADTLIDKAQREAGYDKLMNMDNRIVYPIGSPRVHKAFSLNISRDISADEGSSFNYLRFLNLETGVSTTRFETASGVHETHIAASFKDNYSAFFWSAPTGKLNLRIDFKLPGGLNVFGTQIMTGASYKWVKKNDTLILSWQYNPEISSKGYYAFIQMDSVDAEALVSGDKALQIESSDVGIDISGNCNTGVLSAQVKDASEMLTPSISISSGTGLTLWVKVVKIEEGFFFEGYTEFEKEFNSIEKSFDRLTEDNRVVLGGKMSRSSIRLGKEKDNFLSGEELLKKCHSENETYPALMDKLYDMGRFYQIVDTGDIPPMWGQHNINTNLQVCAGNNTGLFDEMDVYFRYYENKFEDFRTNAKRLFGARGLLASVHCDPDSGLFYHFSRTYPHYCWTGCLGWIYNEFWGYYLVTGDKAFLEKRIVPALKEIALFFEDYACLRDERGKSIFVPSFSPEDPTPNPDYSTVTCSDIHATRINSVMDVAICREVLTNLIEACKTLNIERENISGWEKQLEDLPVYLLDEEGALKEWAWESIEENYNHRHVSHHYDLWPGRAVTVDREPEVSEAILLSNRKRGQQDDSAHGIIHRAFCAIRLKDKEEFVQNLSQLINHGFVRNTLSTNHFPYRLQFPDLQGAMPALLLEMCVYSEPGRVEFLPAVPNDFAQGELSGIWLYSFAKMEKMSWDLNGVRAEIISNREQTIEFVIRRNAGFVINGEKAATETTNETDSRWKNISKVSCHFKAGEKKDIQIMF